MCLCVCVWAWGGGGYLFQHDVVAGMMVYGNMLRCGMLLLNATRAEFVKVFSIYLGNLFATRARVS